LKSDIEGFLQEQDLLHNDQLGTDGKSDTLNDFHISVIVVLSSAKENIRVEPAS
jgi:hypothetical protein